MLGSRTLPDTIYDSVRGRILSGELAPGRPVRQDALAGSLGVSKIPVREALARLQSDGLILCHPRRGFEVPPLTAEEAEEIFDLRLQIEPAAAALGCRQADDGDRQMAYTAMATLDAAVREGSEGVSDRNRDFHLSLVRPSGRPLTTSLVERLHAMAERYVRAHLAPEGRAQRARREHAELLEAWMLGRADEVEARLSDHIMATLSDLRGQLG
jgi:DNA-binding GntR family transcriptional regulator